mgnify:CR=1 FL=1
MSEYGSSLEEVNGILITHEHSDHISGLGVVSRKYIFQYMLQKEPYQRYLKTVRLERLIGICLMKLKKIKIFIWEVHYYSIFDIA